MERRKEGKYPGLDSAWYILGEGDKKTATLSFYIYYYYFSSIYDNLSGIGVRKFVFHLTDNSHFLPYFFRSFFSL